MRYIVEYVALFILTLAMACAGSVLPGDDLLLPSGAREIGICTKASGAGDDLTVHGQDVTTGAGGNLVLRAGYGSTGNGVVGDDNGIFH